MPLYKQTETNCDPSASCDYADRFVVKSLLLAIFLKGFGIFSRDLLGTSTVDWRVREFREVLRDNMLTLSKVDGRFIAEIDEAEVLSYASTLSEAGITTVVVNGVFSPLDTSTVTQEEK